MNPRRLRAMKPIVREWAEPRIRDMANAGSADIVGDVAFPLPALTDFRILGFPAEDLEMLKSSCGDRHPNRFEDPETFDIRRSDARKHFTFGKGHALLPGSGARATGVARRL